VLAKTDSPGLRVYAAWLPILKADTEEEAADSAGDLADPRVLHFWNPDMSLAAEASRALRITAQLEQAWDVFLVYGPDATWEGEHLPAPTAWMHHLSQKDPRWMTPDRLLKVVQALLPEPATSKKATPAATAPARRQ